MRYVLQMKSTLEVGKLYFTSTGLTIYRSSSSSSGSNSKFVDIVPGEPFLILVHDNIHYSYKYKVLYKNIMGDVYISGMKIYEYSEDPRLSFSEVE